MRSRARALAITVIFVLAGLARAARAEPQGNAAMTIGVAGVGADDALFDHAEFHLGLRGDVMFGRQDVWDFGIGPYAEIGTLAFDELSFGAGATFHLPIHESFPLVLSLGPFARVGDDGFGVEPGLGGALFWGTRSYNHHAGYIMAAGLSVGYRHVLGDSGETAMTFAAQIDLVAMGLPFVMLAQALRGPSRDARPID